MRALPVTVLAVVIACMSCLPPFAPMARAAEQVVLAQQPTGEDDEAGGQEGGSGDDTGAESGASQEETSATTEEAGPPWTYQMAFLSIALVLLLGLAIARWYYQLIVVRRRGAL